MTAEGAKPSRSPRQVAFRVLCVLLAGLSAVAISSFFLPKGTFPSWLVYFGNVAAGWTCVALLASYLDWRGARSRMHRIHRHLDAGNLTEARREIQVLVLHCEKVAGPQNPITMEWRHCLAETQFKLSQPLEAMRLAKLNLDGRLAVLGRSHRDTMASEELYQQILRELAD